MKINTGDIILCSGNGFYSTRIKRFNRIVGVKGQAAEITHVAEIHDEHSLFEATTLNLYNDKSGVQINEFEEWLENYNGKVWIRRREIYIDAARKWIRHKQLKLVGTPYENGIPGAIELLLCIPRWNFWSKEGHVHCSQGVVMTDRYAGLVTCNINSSNTPPFTFWDGGDYEDYLIFNELLPAQELK